MVDASRLDASTWAGIGLLGLIVFAIGVGIPYLPAAKHLPYRPILAIGVAVLGGVIAALGLGYAYDAACREEPPRRVRLRRPPPGGPTAESSSVRAAPSFGRDLRDPNDPAASAGAPEALRPGGSAFINSVAVRREPSRERPAGRAVTPPAFSPACWGSSP